MSKPVIMVVDDEQNMADYIAKTIVKGDKYEAIPAHSAKEALELLKKNKQLLGGNKIELILLDIKMPEMDGLQFLDKIRKEYSENIGVIMLTAYEDAEKWEKATDGFVAGYIKKPIVEEKLMASIDRFFMGDKERVKMTMETFEEHIEKRDKFEQDSGKKS